MRYFIGLVLLLVWLGSAKALTPLPDNSPGFFSGEWAGTGHQGAYCYMNLSPDGWGWVLIDGGTGDCLALECNGAISNSHCMSNKSSRYRLQPNDVSCHWRNFPSAADSINR